MARTVSLSSAPLAALTAELARRGKELPKLEKKASDLRTQLDTVEAQIAALGGMTNSGGRGARPAGRAAGRGGVRRRPSPSGLTLADAIAKVLGSTPMSPKEIAAAVVDQNLRHTAKTLTTQVSQVLGKDRRFKREGRAQWTRRGAAKE